MRQRRWILLAAAAVAAVYLMYRGQPAATPKPGYADLDTVLADEFKRGWTVAVPPKREGPYRMVPNVAAVPGVPADGSYRVRGKDGVVEEIKAGDEDGAVQKVVELETRDGNVTLVGLRRAKPNQGGG
jgi:hypothetical protein